MTDDPAPKPPDLIHACLIHAQNSGRFDSETVGYLVDELKELRDRAAKAVDVKDICAVIDKHTAAQTGKIYDDTYSGEIKQAIRQLFFARDQEVRK